MIGGSNLDSIAFGLRLIFYWLIKQNHLYHVYATVIKEMMIDFQLVDCVVAEFMKIQSVRA